MKILSKIYNIILNNKFFIFIGSIFTSIILIISIFWGVYLKPKINIFSNIKKKLEVNNEEYVENLSNKLLKLKYIFDSKDLSKIIFKAFLIKDLTRIKEILNLKDVFIFEGKINVYFNKINGEINWNEIQDSKFLNDELEKQIEHWILKLETVEIDIERELLYEKINEEYNLNEKRKNDVIKVLTNPTKTEDEKLLELEIIKNKNPLKSESFSLLSGEIVKLREIKNLNYLNEILRWVKSIGLDVLKIKKQEIKNLWNDSTKKIMKFGLNNLRIKEISNYFSFENINFVSTNDFNEDGDFKIGIDFFIDKLSFYDLESLKTWIESFDNFYNNMLKIKIEKEFEKQPKRKELVKKVLDNFSDVNKINELLGFIVNDNNNYYNYGLKKEHFSSIDGTFNLSFHSEFNNTEKLEKIIDEWIPNLITYENQINKEVLIKQIIEEYTQELKENYKLLKNIPSYQIPIETTLKEEDFESDFSFKENVLNSKSILQLNNIKEWVESLENNSEVIRIKLQRLRDEINLKLSTNNLKSDILIVLKNFNGNGQLETNEQKQIFLEITECGIFSSCKYEWTVDDFDLTTGLFKITSLNNFDKEKLDQINIWIDLLITNKIKIKILKTQIKLNLNEDKKNIWFKANKITNPLDKFDALKLNPTIYSRYSIENLNEFNGFFNYSEKELNEENIEKILDVLKLNKIKSWTDIINDDMEQEIEKAILIGFLINQSEEDVLNELIEDQKFSFPVSLTREDMDNNFVFIKDKLKLKTKEQLENIKNWLKDLIKNKINSIYTNEINLIVKRWKNFAIEEEQKLNMYFNEENSITFDSFNNDGFKGGFLSNKNIIQLKAILEWVKNVETYDSSVEYKVDLNKIKEFFETKGINTMTIDDDEIQTGFKISVTTTGWFGGTFYYDVYFKIDLDQKYSKDELSFAIFQDDYSWPQSDTKLGTGNIILNNNGKYDITIESTNSELKQKLGFQS